MVMFKEVRLGILLVHSHQAVELREQSEESQRHNSLESCLRMREVIECPFSVERQRKFKHC